MPNLSVLKFIGLRKSDEAANKVFNAGRTINCLKIHSPSQNEKILCKIKHCQLSILEVYPDWPF